MTLAPRSGGGGGIGGGAAVIARLGVEANKKHLWDLIFPKFFMIFMSKPMLTIVARLFQGHYFCVVQSKYLLFASLRHM